MFRRRNSRELCEKPRHGEECDHQCGDAFLHEINLVPMPWALGLGITGGMFESSTLARLSVLIRRTTNKFRSARANVRVVQAGDGASFAVEAFAQCAAIGEMIRQNFD